MIKDLRGFTDLLDSLVMPDIDQSLTEIVNKIRSAISQCRSIPQNYTNAYNSCRVYNIRDGAYDDLTTEEMAASATAVLENAVAELQGTLEYLNNARTGSKFRTIVPGSGHVPVIGWNQEVFSQSSFGVISFKPHLVSTPSGVLGDYLVTSQSAGLVLIGRVESVAVAATIYLELDNGEVHVNGAYFFNGELRVKTLVRASISGGAYTPSTPMSQLWSALPDTIVSTADDWQLANQDILLMGWLREGTPVRVTGNTNFDHSAALSNAIRAAALTGLDWSLYDQTTDDVDALQAMLALYPNIQPLIDAIEAIL